MKIHENSSYLSLGLIFLLTDYHLFSILLSAVGTCRPNKLRGITRRAPTNRPNFEVVEKQLKNPVETRQEPNLLMNIMNSSYRHVHRWIKTLPNIRAPSSIHTPSSSSTTAKPLTCRIEKDTLFHAPG